MRIQGRISSMEAPVVPSRFATTAPTKQEHRVRARSGFAFYIDVNPAGDHEQRADQGDKTDVFLRDMQTRAWACKPKT